MQTNNHKILIVDDVSRNIQVVAQILQPEGYQISFAKDGPTALDRVKHSDFDLILLDIMMPGMDGYEVCRRLRQMKNLTEIPVIFLSARSDKDSVVRGFESGGQDYVTKPFNEHELLARVRTHLLLLEQKRKLSKWNQRLEEQVRLRTAEVVEQKQKLEIANRKLRRLDEAKTNFLGLISHELNTPLNGILGITSLLEETELSDEAQELLPGLRISSERLLSFSRIAILITQLKADRFKRIHEPVYSSGLTQSAIDRFGPKIEKKQLQIVPPDEEIIVQGDAVLLDKALNEILKNAITASSAGGTIRLAIGNRNNEAFLTVSDEGPGFSEEAREQLFQIFNSSGIMHHSEGFGLGLAAAHLIMHLHEGWIEIPETGKPEGVVHLFFRNWEKAGEITRDLPGSISPDG